MLIQYWNKCRLCGEKETLKEIYNFGPHKLHGLFRFKNYTPPERTIPSVLLRCDQKLGGCGLVQLNCSVEPDILYSKYGYRSSGNDTMKNHLKDIAKQAIYLLEPNENSFSDFKIMDVGANDGYFLSQFWPQSKKIAIDPSDVVRTIELENTTIINKPFPLVDNKYSNSVNFFAFLACFYDCNNPNYVASCLFDILKNDGFGVIEVAYWPRKMELTAIDEICDEHVCFYSYDTIAQVLESQGLKIFRAVENEINGGSLQVWVAKNTCDKYDNIVWNQQIQNLKIKEFDMSLDEEWPYLQFINRIEILRTKAAELFAKIKKEGKTVHMLGASTKASIFTSVFSLTEYDIPYASERSIEKIGGKTLNGNISMISEEDSRNMNPNYYWCPIWGFKKEVVKREEEFILNGGTLIFPIPNMLEINKDNYLEHI